MTYSGLVRQLVTSNPDIAVPTFYSILLSSISMVFSSTVPGACLNDVALGVDLVVGAPDRPMTRPMVRPMVLPTVDLLGWYLL